MTDILQRLEAVLGDGKVPKPHSYGQGTSGADFMRPFYWADEVEAVIEAQAAEIEGLRVCVMCSHKAGIDDSCYCGTVDDWDEMVGWYDHCHFTPSRWQPVEGGDRG